MAVNGPMKMYAVKPLYDFSPTIELPTCMYKMNNLYDDDKADKTTVTPNKEDLYLLAEKQQLNILQKLEDLKVKVLRMKEDLGVVNHNSAENIEQFQDIVVKANPENPPLSLWVFYKLLSETVPVRIVSYIHSSLVNVPEFLKQLPIESCVEPCKVSLTVIWKDGKNDTEMVVNPIHQGTIEGEVNIARYIARLLGFNYETDPILSTQIDDWLEIANSSIIYGNNKERQSALKSLNSHLGKNTFLVQDSLSLADIVVWSSLAQNKLHEDLPSNVSKWFKLLLENDLFEFCRKLPFL